MAQHFTAAELNTIVNNLEELQDETGLAWEWVAPHTYISDQIPSTQVRYSIGGPEGGRWRVAILDGGTAIVREWFTAASIVAALQDAIDPIRSTILNGP